MQTNDQKLLKLFVLKKQTERCDGQESFKGNELHVLLNVYR